MTPTPPARPLRFVDPVFGAKLVVTTGLGLLLFIHGELLYRLPVQRLPWPPHEWWAVPALIGLLLPLCYWSGWRALGMIPVAVAVAYGCGVVAQITGRIPDGLLAVTLFAYGVACGALIRHASRGLFQRRGRNRPNEPRAVVSRSDAGLLLLVLVALACLVVLWNTVATEATPLWWRDVYTGVFYLHGAVIVVFAWWRLFRPFFELCVEPVLRIGYKIHKTGPGVNAVPYHGPLLVIANHACWWDPLFLADVVPRPVTPMMTARFYDRWFLRPLMVYTFGVIRVPEGSLRREAPEIQDAIAALDAGKCLVIFPEGFLRRKEEQPLRRFGRGVWEILKARPNTPVLACWIEGGWGSWASYWNGPPTKNKKPDFRRLIRIGVAAPTTVPPEVLGHHLQTRIMLMNRVLAARTHLGLPALPAVELPTKDDLGDG
jgi:1-acyl-sn-glycerol-3-phosphate acyltransferase